MFENGIDHRRRVVKVTGPSSDQDEESFNVRLQEIEQHHLIHGRIELISNLVF